MDTGIFLKNGFFIPGPSLAAEKQGLGLKFSIENEIVKPRMKTSIENENFQEWPEYGWRTRT